MADTTEPASSRYLVKEVTTNESYIIEAAQYSFDAVSGRHCFLDAEGNTVACLVNVNVRKLAAGASA